MDGPTTARTRLAEAEEAAKILGIPYGDITQCALIPVAHALGSSFKAGPRKPLDAILHVEQQLEVELNSVNDNPIVVPEHVEAPDDDPTRWPSDLLARLGLVDQGKDQGVRTFLRR